MSNKRGMNWTKDRNDILRGWCEEGLTVRQICAKAVELFEEDFTEPQIRSHLKFIGAKPAPMRAERKVRITADMKSWISIHRDLPPSFLVLKFRATFGMMGKAVAPRDINRIAARARIVAATRRPDDELAEDWERAKRLLSPKGKVARTHWLWRYMPLDESRGASGVKFREV